MTDNAWGYRKGVAFANALAQLGAAHKLYRPQTNGKVEFLDPLHHQPPAAPSPRRLLITITTDPTAP